MLVLDIVFISIAVIMLIIMSVIVFKSNKQFRDKSLGLIEGMKEDEVLEIMEKDPDSIDITKDGENKWTFERRDFKGWGYQILVVEIYFDEFNIVKRIERSYKYDRPSLNKNGNNQ